MIKLISLSWVALLVLACNDETDRKETVTKLRTVGVESTPSVAVPGQEMTLRFLLVAPKDQNLAPTATPYDDAAFFRYGTTTLATLTSPNPSVQDLGALQLFVFEAKIVLPSDPLTLASIQENGQARVRYGISVSTPQGDSETVVGDALAVKADSSLINRPNLSATILKPLDTSISSGKTDIKAESIDDNSETLRAGWLVSSGKIKAPNAKETEWDEMSTGSQTAIFTLRGKLSGRFTYQVKTIEVR